MNETEKIWMNGELVDWADAKIHVATHGLHYGTGVFEGIRCYETERGPAIFRLRDHMKRLVESAKLLYMEIPYSLEELDAAVLDTVGANGLQQCYIRPIAYVGYGELGVNPGENPVDVSVLAWPWGAYLGEDGQKNGITAKISSWQRIGPNVIPHVAKATGIYLNSMLATTEARRGGYDEAIMLTEQGMVADGPGESIFVVKNGKISTPDLSASILTGVTRDSVMQIAADLGYELQEKQIIRTELYLADEVFMTGTAAEIVPLRAIDDIEIGKPGPVTQAIQQAYADAVRGRSERWAHWLEYVPSRTQA
jgi:branched-chain amino acid aminotransferase